MPPAGPNADLVASALQYLPLAGAFVGGMVVAGIMFWLTGRVLLLTRRAVLLARRAVRLTRRIEIVPQWAIVAVICVAIVGLAGVFARQIDFIQVMLILLLGSAALVATVQVIDRLQRGESIELQSHWGGLGGAIGGWRLSPVTGLLLLALVLAGSAIGVGVGGKKDGHDSTTNPPVKDAGKDVGKDAGKAAPPKGGTGGQASEPPTNAETPPKKG